MNGQQPYRLLFSFAYYGDRDLDQIIADDLPMRPDVFADSGAFTAHSLGADVRLDDYMAWCERWRDLFVCYANLDVIGNAEGTYANQQAMEAAGFRPMPVFHGGEPWEYLREYCASHDYVCLGGMVAHSMNAALRWCAQAFQIGAEHGTRFHGFGQTNLRIIKSFPWYSVDSSSWGSGHRYGMVTLWDGQAARWRKVKTGDHAQVYAHARLIRDHGADPALLARPKCGLMREGFSVEDVRDERAVVSGTNVIAWRRLERWLNDWHGQSTAVYLGGKTDSMHLGYSPRQRVYLAEGTWHNFRTALRRAHTMEAP